MHRHTGLRKYALHAMTYGARNEPSRCRDCQSMPCHAIAHGARSEPCNAVCADAGMLCANMKHWAAERAFLHTAKGIRRKEWAYGSLVLPATKKNQVLDGSRAAFCGVHHPSTMRKPSQGRGAPSQHRRKSAARCWHWQSVCEDLVPRCQAHSSQLPRGAQALPTRRTSHALAAPTPCLPLPCAFATEPEPQVTEYSLDTLRR
jgi:hypothetical protein